MSVDRGGLRTTAIASLLFLAAPVAVASLGACGGGDDAPTASPGTPVDDGGVARDDGATARESGAPGDAATTRDAGPIDWTVNGHALSAREQAPVMVMASNVMPRLAGTREERLTFAARGAWWALKEGTWEQALPAVYGYSNCNTSTGDQVIGPTETCAAGRAWQVGLAAVQVPGHTAAELEARAAVLFPGTTSDALLSDVAMKAGESKATSATIVASSGSLRASWLLRVPALGFDALVPGEVVPECIDGTKSWCFGSGWDETKKFAPTKDAAVVAIGDLHRILDALVP